jgi:hypothetical protein
MLKPEQSDGSSMREPINDAKEITAEEVIKFRATHSDITARLVDEEVKRIILQSQQEQTESGAAKE